MSEAALNAKLKSYDTTGFSWRGTVWSWCLLEAHTVDVSKLQPPKVETWRLFDLILINRLRQDLETASRELGKLKDRHLEQAVKYSRALEEQGKASTRERDLLRQVGRLATPGAKQTL